MHSITHINFLSTTIFNLNPFNDNAYSRNTTAPFYISWDPADPAKRKGYTDLYTPFADGPFDVIRDPDRPAKRMVKRW
jgi:hypothetical protein